MERTFMLAPKMPLGSLGHPSQLHMITLIDKKAVRDLFPSFLRRCVCKPAIEIDWRAKIMGNCARCRGEPKIVNNSNYCFLNQKDDLRLLWLWKLLIKLRRSGRRHFCIAKSSFKDLDHNISETRIWGVLTSTLVTLSFTLSMKVEGSKKCGLSPVDL